MLHIDKTPDLGGKDYCMCSHAQMLFDAIDRATDICEEDPDPEGCGPEEDVNRARALMIERIQQELMDAYHCHKAAELAFEQNIESTVPR